MCRSPSPARRAELRSGSGSGSPSTSAIMRSTASRMPPKKSPLRKRGTITCVDDAIREHVRQRALQTARPTSMRTARSSFATSSTAPSFDAADARASTLRRRGCSTARSFPAASSARSARRSGCPSSLRTRAAAVRARAICSGVSVPVRSVTGARSGGTATSASAPEPNNSSSESAGDASQRACIGWRDQPGDFGLGLGLQAERACRSPRPAAWRSSPRPGP